MNFFRSLVDQKVKSLTLAIAVLGLSFAGGAECQNVVVEPENKAVNQIENSPLLQRWLKQPPDLLQEIRETPSFNTKVGLKLISRDQNLGFAIALDDLFIGRSPLTFSAGFEQEFARSSSNLDLNLRYYLLPLGDYFNLAPQIGYRAVAIADQPFLSGLDFGIQGIFALSPRSADIRIAQTWTSIGSNSEISTTKLSASYAILPQLRLGSSIQWQRSPIRADSRVGIGLEFSF
jgi:hypothetical protein